MGKYDKKPANPSREAQTPASPNPVHSPPASVSDNPELKRVAQYLAKVRFQKKVVGGLDPGDVWKKIEALNALYEDALIAERVRCNLLIRQVHRQGGPSQEDAHGES